MPDRETIRHPVRISVAGGTDADHTWALQFNGEAQRYNNARQALRAAYTAARGHLSGTEESFTVYVYVRRGASWTGTAYTFKPGDELQGG